MVAVVASWVVVVLVLVMATTQAVVDSVAALAAFAATTPRDSLGDRLNGSVPVCFGCNDDHTFSPGAVSSCDLCRSSQGELGGAADG